MIVPNSTMPYILIDPAKFYVVTIIGLYKKGFTKEDLDLIANLMLDNLLEATVPDDRPTDKQKFLEQITEFIEKIKENNES